MQEIKPEDARTLLQSTQQLRTHFSGLITQHLGFVITANLVIWSYFIKSYVDSISGQSQDQPLYILAAASLSSILLGLPRLFTYWIDDNIANLYPEFLLYESRLTVPPIFGTSGYLTRLVPNANLIFLNDELTLDQKLKGISALIKKKRMGHRGHRTIDILVMLVILGMLFVGICFLDQSHLLQFQPVLSILLLVGIGIGILLLLLGMFCFQKNPRKDDIKKILLRLKGDDENKGLYQI